MSLVTGIDFRDARAVFGGAAGGNSLGFFEVASLGCSREKQRGRGAKGKKTGECSEAVHGASRKNLPVIAEGMGSCKGRQPARQNATPDSMQIWLTEAWNEKKSLIIIIVISILRPASPARTCSARVHAAPSAYGIASTTMEQPPSGRPRVGEAIAN